MHRLYAQAVHNNSASGLLIALLEWDLPQVTASQTAARDSPVGGIVDALMGERLIRKKIIAGIVGGDVRDGPTQAAGAPGFAPTAPIGVLSRIDLAEDESQRRFHSKNVIGNAGKIGDGCRQAGETRAIVTGTRIDGINIAIAVAMVRRSILTRLTLARVCASRKFGTAITARMTMIAATISNSMSVNPLLPEEEKASVGDKY